MRLPLAASIETRDGALDKDAKLVNCFVDTEGDTAYVVKRPGLQKRVVSTAGTALGIVSWEGQLYHATGSNIYQTNYSTIPSSGGSPSATLVNTYEVEAYSIAGAGGYNLVAAEGSAVYIYTTGGTVTEFRKSTDGGATWTLVDSGSYPPGAYLSDMCVKSGSIYLVGENGVAKSSDGGASFSSITLGAPPWRYPATCVLGITVHGGDLYVMAPDPSYPTLNVSLYKSTNDGVTWSLVSTYQVSYPEWSPVGRLKCTGLISSGGKIYAVIQTNTSPNRPVLLVSSDNGATWSGITCFTLATNQEANISTNGTNILLSQTNGTDYRIYYIDPDTLDQTLVLTIPSFVDAVNCHPRRKATVLVGSNAYILIDVVSNFTSLYKLTFSLSSPTTSPGNSYAFTTTTPGLPLSWVGTSPGTATKRLFIKNTEQAWTLTLGSPGTLTQVTDADYPAVTVPGAVYLDGYFFVMDGDGTIYNCDLENPTSWNSLNYITAEAEWDKGVAIAKHQNYVVALKDWTTELFYDAANPTGSPLSKVSNATIQLGCAQGYSVVQFHGGLIFMSKTREKGRSVHFFPADGIAPQEIASPAIQRVLNRADLTSVSAWGGKIAGRILYVLNLVTADITLVYDFTTQTWTQWTSDTSGTEGHFKCGFYATDGSRDFLLHESTGDIFALDPAVYQDDGANIDVLIRSGRTDGGNLNRKTMSALTIVGDQAATSVTVSVSDDDYQTFSTARTVSMSDKPPRLRRMGMFRRRSFDIRHVDNTPLRLVAIDAEMEQAR